MDISIMIFYEMSVLERTERGGEEKIIYNDEFE